MTITCEKISKSYDGKPALESVTLEVDAGSFFTLLGPTGAGKTTLLRILAGIEKPDSGVVRYDGIDVARLPPAERSVAFVYQRFVNYPSLTLFENIASPLRVARPKWTKADIDRRVWDVAELLGLTQVLDHLPEHVSGGQQQRCAIGRALAKGARHVFLDEPLANLDYKLREELRTELKQIFKARSGSVVYATPDPVDVLMMATHVGILRDGRLLQSGETRRVYEHPSQANVAAYFSHPAMNLIPCAVAREGNDTLLRLSDELTVRLEGQRPELRRAVCVAGIRPHHLDLRPCSRRSIPFRATAELAEVVGSSTELHLRHGGIRIVLLLPRVERFAPGQELTCFLDPAELYLFDADTGGFLTRTVPDGAPGWPPLN